MKTYLTGQSLWVKVGSNARPARAKIVDILHADRSAFWDCIVLQFPPDLAPILHDRGPEGPAAYRVLYRAALESCEVRG